MQYKLLYMGRHGEGYHNVAEAFYGTPAWDVSETEPLFVRAEKSSEKNMEADGAVVLLVRAGWKLYH